jgi:hypothetical protein
MQENAGPLCVELRRGCRSSSVAAGVNIFKFTNLNPYKAISESH